MFQPLAGSHWRIVHLAAYNPHQMLLPVLALMIHSAMSNLVQRQARRLTGYKPTTKQVRSWFARY
jgi:hypothetical protein